MTRKPGQFRMLLAEYCLSRAFALAGDYWSTPTLRCFGALVESIFNDTYGHGTEEARGLVLWRLELEIRIRNRGLQ